MASPVWVQKVLAILKEQGKVPENHTGEAVLTLNIGQGGLNSAKITVTETIK
jgi:hypothetical protein